MIVALFISTLLQSCKVYYELPVSVEKAISSEQKIKIVLNNNVEYTFCKLIVRENQLFGITKINSTTAKKMDSLIVRCSVDGKIAKIKLIEKDIKEVYLKK